MASRTAAYGRACYQWSLKRGSLGPEGVGSSVNPFMGLSLGGPVKRERILTNDEIAAPSGERRPGQAHMTVIVRLLILTGQRRGEVAGMTRDELDADLSNMVHPKQPHQERRRATIPLSPQAQAIISACPQFDGSNLIFRGRRGPLQRLWQGPGRPWTRPAASRTGVCMIFAAPSPPVFSGSASGSK